MDSSERGSGRSASPVPGGDGTAAARPKGRPGRKPKGSVPAVVIETPDHRNVDPSRCDLT